MFKRKFSNKNKETPDYNKTLVVPRTYIENYILFYKNKIKIEKKSKLKRKLANVNQNKWIGVRVKKSKWNDSNRIGFVSTEHITNYSG